MAKNKIEEIEMEQPEKKRGFFQNFFTWFLIPIVFCIAILVVVTMFTEKNIFEYIEELPFVSSEKESDTDEISSSTKEKIVSLQAQLKEKEAQITKIQADYNKATAENEELQTEIERLNYELEKVQIGQEDTKKEFNEILSTFEKMSAKKAAPIITQMEESEAVRLLSSMKPATLKAIFEKMSPEDAAKYTQLITE